MNLELYIRSRGFNQNFDYCWTQVTENTHDRKETLPELFENDANTLIYSESSSLILSRRNDRLFLLITAIEPKERLDFSGRQVRISIAWIGDDLKENELVFRKMAAQVLTDEGISQITEQISEAVTFGGQYGFQGDFIKLQNIIKLDTDIDSIQSNTLTEYKQTSHKLAKLTPQMKKKLAEELLQFQLPKVVSSSEGYPLVVVTEIKKEETLRKAFVWRGLSGLIDRDDWWIYYPPAQHLGELLWFVMRTLFKFNREWGRDFRAILESVFLNSDDL
ncbi:hypothetical protein [Spirulina sp. 06S082]|uniref:hypothetical protein n=1 Tax=Spirulina sp. 06S082 TaxID=3110248 RepID=UPI002B1F81C8|nr:hypothetical protein [Spirulina sp. 06S082]MEA5472060.1 hypothetical protein [Spirulina sp. 06S082]